VSNSIITVENLGKKYALRHLRDQRYIALRDVLVEKATGLFRRGRRNGQQDDGTAGQLTSREDFWALKNVSFEVKQGEVIGIIGRNGAGKSTLLKILSRITDPTEGRVRIRGRVASLLEVGTGFHPELTGRENIYLNGAILGMTRAEINKKFDEIVAFAETEKFLDTPVKRYSSGMYVRLAFAVAAHLEPEILIVDEVLAVGDAEFQRKCLGRMHEVAKGGRTVIFVSHNMSAIRGLCTRAICLSHGELYTSGEVNECVARYLSHTRDEASECLKAPTLIGSALELRQLKFLPNPVESGKPVTILLEFYARQPTRITELAIGIYSQFEVRAANLDLRSCVLPIDIPANQTREIAGEIRTMPLVEGEYPIGIYIVTNDFSGNLLDLLRLTISARPLSYTPYAPVYRGIVELDFKAEQAS
jgi:lipopolysaccharide transport system ATP-binding protein